MALTPGRRTLLTLGLPLSLAFIGYAALGIMNAVGLTRYTDSLTVVPVGQVQVLAVDARDGSVRLEPSADGNVHVRVKGVYALSRPRLTTASTAAGVTVTGRQCSGGGINICTQDVTIEVPAGFRVTATSGGGDVRASGLTGEVSLSSSAGSVHDDGAVGRLVMSSSAGDVSGTNLRSSDVTASSSGGDVDLTFGADPTRVEAGSSAGDVAVRVPGAVAYRVTVKSSGGSATSTVHEDSASTRTIDAHSSAGDVSVRPSG
ncbi:MAG: hypothetical protein QOE76_3917 [Frankiales bacterium]|jgi:hypothetical protein|nr:hypothetical protein [Frankiales bacterium]